MREYRTIETVINTLGSLGDFKGALRAKWLNLSALQGDLSLDDKVKTIFDLCLGANDKPFAVFNGIQKGFKKIKDFPIYTVFWEGHKLHGSTVTRETLNKIGIKEIRLSH